MTVTVAATATHAAAGSKLLQEEIQILRYILTHRYRYEYFDKAGQPAHTHTHTDTDTKPRGEIFKEHQDKHTHLHLHKGHTLTHTEAHTDEHLLWENEKLSTRHKTTKPTKKKKKEPKEKSESQAKRKFSCAYALFHTGKNEGAPGDLGNDLGSVSDKLII